MAKFAEGQIVYSASGKTYIIRGVYDYATTMTGKRIPVAPDPIKGVRYGVQCLRDGVPFGPFRNLHDTTAFATDPTA